MSDHRTARVQQVFADALEFPPEQRAEFVARSCADDPELHSKVKLLLAAHVQADEAFLSPPAMHLAQDPRGADIAQSPGQRVGRYTLLERIGEGGFGTVFLAEQVEPVRR